MQKPALRTPQILNMCFGFFGIQVGFALQNANVSRIFQTLGADLNDIPILWIAAPLTGLLVQPIIGYMSDRTWGWLGRRRPYFFYGALATTFALFFMPNSPTLWVAAGMLWIMDAAINVTMEPFRAFVGDMLPERQRTTGFATQTFFIGFGGVTAAVLPFVLTEWFGVANTAPAGQIPPSVKYAFYFGGAMVLTSVMWTVLTTKEYSPEEVAAFEKALADQSPQAAAAEKKTPKTAWYRNGGTVLVVSGVLTVLVAQFSLEKELYILTIGGVFFGLLQIAAGLLTQRNQVDNPFSEIMGDLFTMPRTMKQLAVVQFFSWFAFFSMWIYMLPGVAASHYGTLDPTSEIYNRAGNWVGILMGAKFGIAALAAFIIPALAARTSRKITHALCLTCGGLGLASVLIIRDPAFLWISMVGVGIAWASILSVPYAILSGALPLKKMGVYMGIFNFFIVIPQLTAASILGLLVTRLFDGAAIYALLAGGISLGLGAIATLMVDDKDDQYTTVEADSVTAPAVPQPRPVAGE
ncbi:MAG: MFS transporter [Pseudomonadota bacterium]